MYIQDPPTPSVDAVAMPTGERGGAEGESVEEGGDGSISPILWTPIPVAEGPVSVPCSRVPSMYTDIPVSVAEVPPSVPDALISASEAQAPVSVSEVPGSIPWAIPVLLPVSSLAPPPHPAPANSRTPAGEVRGSGGGGVGGRGGGGGGGGVRTPPASAGAGHWQPTTSPSREEGADVDLYPSVLAANPRGAVKGGDTDKSLY
jgi:hypothetical protein